MVLLVENTRFIVDPSVLVSFKQEDCALTVLIFIKISNFDLFKVKQFKKSVTMLHFMSSIKACQSNHF